MLKIDTLSLGDYQTNTYIVRDSASKTCAIIDPGYDAQTILGTVEKLGLAVDAVLLTHGHFDHVGAVEEIVRATGCKLWMREADWTQFDTPMNRYLFPIANCDFCEVWFCEDFEEITAGGLTFTVWETPGHTWGSVCFLCEDALFSGDTLFAGGCGRTDLGGSWTVILQSLKRLAEVEADLRVFPGHGPDTTLNYEKKFNPYMRQSDSL